MIIHTDKLSMKYFYEFYGSLKKVNKNTKDNFQMLFILANELNNNKLDTLYKIFELCNIAIPKQKLILKQIKLGHAKQNLETNRWAIRDIDKEFLIKEEDDNKFILKFFTGYNLRILSSYGYDNKNIFTTNTQLLFSNFLIPEKLIDVEIYDKVTEGQYQYVHILIKDLLEAKIINNEEYLNLKDFATIFGLPAWVLIFKLSLLKANREEKSLILNPVMEHINDSLKYIEQTNEEMAENEITRLKNDIHFKKFYESFKNRKCSEIFANFFHNSRFLFTNRNIYDESTDTFFEVRYAKSTESILIDLLHKSHMLWYLQRHELFDILYGIDCMYEIDYSKKLDFEIVEKILVTLNNKLYSIEADLEKVLSNKLDNVIMELRMMDIELRLWNEKTPLPHVQLERQMQLLGMLVKTMKQKIKELSRFKEVVLLERVQSNNLY